MDYKIKYIKYKLKYNILQTKIKNSKLSNNDITNNKKTFDCSIIHPASIIL